MVHTERPLQEKMTLFWHNHFATAYSKIAGTLGAADGTREMAAKAAETAAGVPRPDRTASASTRSATSATC